MVSILILLALTAPVMAAVQNQWVSNGPYSGEVQDILMIPNKPNELLASVVSGRVYHSKNWGLNWEEILEINSDGPCLASSSDGSFLFIGSSAGIFRSPDQGESWVVWSDLYAASIAVSPHDSSVIMVGSLDGLYITRNNGSTWDKLDGIPSVQIDSIAFHPQYPNLIYVGCSSVGIFRTYNGGASWTPVYSAAGSLYRVKCHPTIPGRVFASSWYPISFAISDDFGGSWDEIPNGPFSSDLAFHPQQPDKMYAISIQGISQSTDGGWNWTLDRTHGGRALAIDQRDIGGTIYAGTLAGVHRSRDAGTSWHSTSTGLNEVDVSIAVSPQPGGNVLPGRPRRQPVSHHRQWCDFLPDLFPRESDAAEVNGCLARDPGRAAGVLQWRHLSHRRYG